MTMSAKAGEPPGAGLPTTHAVGVLALQGASGLHVEVLRAPRRRASRGPHRG